MAIIPPVHSDEEIPEGMIDECFEEVFEGFPGKPYPKYIFCQGNWYLLSEPRGFLYKLKGPPTGCARKDGI